jgi:uncharacterized lipoprotein YmbA
LAISTVLVLLVGGCASSPPARFYTLNAEAGPPAPASRIAVVVGPVSVPEEVNRPQMVVRSSTNEVRFEEFQRWALPLQNDIARVVAENLVAMLGTPRVTLSAQDMNPNAEFQVGIEVQRFEATVGGSATFDAVWTVRHVKSGKSDSGRSSVREPLGATNFEAIAAAFSRAIARMSLDIASGIREFAPSSDPRAGRENVAPAVN